VTLQRIARALNGTVIGDQVLAPSPNHSPNDRSLSVWIDPGSPNGFRVHSFAGDDWRVCRDHVRERLSLACHRRRNKNHAWTPEAGSAQQLVAPGHDERKRIEQAQALWREGVPISGTIAEQYLRYRGFERGIGWARSISGPLQGSGLRSAIRRSKSPPSTAE
jgi:putative DNA primase/helicase